MSWLASLVRGFSAVRALGTFGCVSLIACLMSVGCHGRDDARLLSLTALSPADLTLGETLRVRGQGFPTGADCEIELHGQLWRPGEAARSLDLVLPAQAISADEATATVSVERMPQVSSHATFVGTVSLAFAAAKGDGRVSGRLEHVTLDVQRADADVAQRFAQQRDAEETLRTLGIVLEEEASEDGGLRVRWAREGSVAADALVQQGDVLTHLGGLRLRAVADFVPAAGASKLEVRVRPSATPRERVVSLALDTHQTAVSQAGLLISIVGLLVLACLVWLAPSPRRLVFFRSLSRETPISRSRLDFGESNATGMWRLVPTVAWPLLAAVAWISLAVSQRWDLNVHLLVVAAFIAAAYLVARSLGRDAGFGVRALSGDLGLLALVLLPLACAGLVGGSGTIAGLVERQGALPWQWFVFKVPPLLLAAVVFVLAARRIVERTTSLHRAHATLFAIVLAGIGAAVLMGGWQPIGFSFARLVDPAALGIVAFAIKAWLLMLVMVVPRQAKLVA